jgi:hypothetical protein
VTKSEREHLDRVTRDGCVLCERMGFSGTPAEVHHQRSGTGAGRRASHFDVAALCPEHHRGNTGIHGMGRRAFERHHGVTERELVEATQRRGNGGRLDQG